MADTDSQKESAPAEKNDIFLAIKNNPIPALSLSLAVILTSIGLLYSMLNSWNNSLASILILIIILLILPMAIAIGLLFIVSNTSAYERLRRKKISFVIIYAVLFVVCCSLAYACVPKTESISANPPVTPTIPASFSPTQNPASAQGPTTVPSGDSGSIGRATINLKDGGTIKNATIEFGPRGWNSYVTTSFEYTDNLSVIAQATGRPESGRFLQLANAKSIDFIEMSDDEQNVIDENTAYRNHIRKVCVTYNDGRVVNNVYMLEYAYYETGQEHGSIQDAPVTAIVYE